MYIMYLQFNILFKFILFIIHLQFKFQKIKQWLRLLMVHVNMIAPIFWYYVNGLLCEVTHLRFGKK
jgi:hypothetical protein